jgi:hypothetical protein
VKNSKNEETSTHITKREGEGEEKRQRKKKKTDWFWVGIFMPLFPLFEQDTKTKNQRK